MPDEAIFERSFEVRFHEADPELRLLPVHLFLYLQEVAIHASAAVGRDPVALAPHGWGWFLLRLHMTIVRYPRWRQRLRAQTWAFGMAGPFAIREFRLLDEAGELVTAATSRWVVIDMKRRRAVRVPAWIRDAYTTHERRQIDDPFDDLPAPEHADFAVPFALRWSDIDANRHASSATYVEACLDAVPAELHAGAALSSFEIAFKKEAEAGAVLDSRGLEATAPGDAERTFHHRVVQNPEGTTLALARSRWRSRIS